ncbi:MAG: cupin domain-containing protein [Gammaproteobacteria bacterium]|nr:cupin domain-containing protein [Gammaproteobacteria bacterium]
MRHRAVSSFHHPAVRLSILLALPLAVGAGTALAHDHQEAADTSAATAADAGEQTVVVVSAPEEIVSKQRLPQFVGISGESAGAKGLSMSLVVIPPGAAAEPHTHSGYESAVYLLEGRVETRYGPGLKQSVINEAGDFLFIPANVPHQPVNLSDTEPARAIVSRNDPNEQEHVIPYDPAADAR